MYDLIIIGSGPAGLAAAIYAQRANLSCLTIEKEMMSGGQIINTEEVDNYPGLPGIGGFDLALKLREHAEGLGAIFAEACVESVENLNGDVKMVHTTEGSFEAKTLILATGAVHRKLQVPGEEEMAGKGVSYCALCDGAFYKDRTVAVVGGGDVAVEDAIFLSKLCRKVYLVHRRDSLRAASSLQEQLLRQSNVEILWNTVVTEIQGENSVQSLLLAPSNQNGISAAERKSSESLLHVDGIFVAVGIQPRNELFEALEMNDNGYIVADESGTTSIPGVFVAGDLRQKPLRQIVTAVADGANAASSAEKYLAQLGE
ncbi:MAG: thioredoxin-disulfide reductase [Clostridiales bacterium]|nr:thioredoxin-disulfide reductase [Clostridiales bacterium]